VHGIVNNPSEFTTEILGIDENFMTSGNLSLHIWHCLKFTKLYTSNLSLLLCTQPLSSHSLPPAL
jgi:hypothetical protein